MPKKTLVVYSGVPVDLIEKLYDFYMDYATDEMKNPEKNTYNPTYRRDTGMIIGTGAGDFLVYSTYETIKMQPANAKKVLQMEE